jgi:hypothetical protein
MVLNFTSTAYQLASSIPNWLTFKLLRLVQILNRLLYLVEMLYGSDDVEDDIDSMLLNLLAPSIRK